MSCVAGKGEGRWKKRPTLCSSLCCLGVLQDAYETIKERNVKNFGQNDNQEYEGGRAPVWEPADAARDMNEGNMSEVAEINKGDDKVRRLPCLLGWVGRWVVAAW